MRVKAEVVDYTEDDEHILRRLGCAIVVQWPNLPKEIQYLLVEQATFMHDRYQTAQLKQQISGFIKNKQDHS